MQNKFSTFYTVKVRNTFSHKVHEKKLQTTRQLHNFFIFIKLCDKFNQNKNKSGLGLKIMLEVKNCENDTIIAWIPGHNNI